MTLTRLTSALAAAGVTSSLLVACGGGGGSDPTPPVVVTPKTVSQVVSVVDGPIKGALVCLDKNANGACDADETQGATAADGSVTLTVPEADAGKYAVLAVVGTDAVDAVNGPVTTAFTMQSPADKPDVVSPLTTLVAAQLAAGGGTTLDAEKSLQDKLGIAVSLFADFSKAAVNDEASRHAATVARMLVVTTQQQLKDTVDAKATDGSTLSKADIAHAINNSLLAVLPTLVAQAADPAVAKAANAAEKELAIKAAAAKLAAEAGLTLANLGTVVAVSKLPGTKDDNSAPAAGASLRWFRFTDAGNYFFRAFKGTALQNTVVDGKRQFTEYKEQRKTVNGSTTEYLQFGEGLNNWQRNSVIWTGTEWFDCPNDQVHEVTPWDANGVASSLYCKANKTTNKRSERDIAGTKMVDLVTEIRAYPLADTAGKFAAWGPDPVTYAAALAGTFPAGSKLFYFSGQDSFNPDTFSPLASDTVLPYSAAVASGVVAECNKVTGSNFAQFQIAAPTLEAMIAAFKGTPCVYAPNANTLANTGEPINEWWSQSTIGIGDVADPYANATGFYRNGVKSLRASFGDGSTVNYWLCLRRASDGSPRNCKPAGAGSYSIETLGDGRAMRFAGLPAIAGNLGYNRVMVERSGRVQYGSRSKLTTSNQLRLNMPAMDALFAALGMPAPQPAAALTPSSLLASYVTGAGSLSTNALAFMENDAAGLVGAWKFASQATTAQTYFFFFANGQYVMVDPLGDEASNTHVSCGGPGVEQGAFTFEATTGAFTGLSVSKDTNGCAGLHDTSNPVNPFPNPLTLTLSNAGQTMTAVAPDGSVVLTRVSK